MHDFTVGTASSPSPSPGERLCACGKTFRDAKLKCRACRAIERTCACGRRFKSTMRQCSSCRGQQRVCVCGKTFKDTKTRCSSCRAAERVCACGTSYRGTNSQCWNCRKKERDCKACGTRFVGGKSECSPCRSQLRQCACGTVYKGQSLKCTTCFRASLPAEVLSARARQARNARRARKYSANGGVPVTSRQYAEIRRGGPCVYCGAQAESVDHVVPLSRGGAEHVDNLVPACGWCNLSKGNKLLDEWWPDLVTNAVAASPKVAAAFAAALPRPAGA